MLLRTTPPGVAFFIFAELIKAANYSINKLEFLENLENINYGNRNQKRMIEN